MPADDVQAASPRPLEAGDPAPRVVALDQEGEPAYSHADLVVGKPLVLLFCPGGDLPAPLLAAFRDAHAAFQALEASIYALSRQPVEATEHAW